MKTSLTVVMSALAVAATTLVSLPASAQVRGRAYGSDGAYAMVPPTGSVYGPIHNPHNYSNGTGNVSDADRDPHNDR